MSELNNIHPSASCDTTTADEEDHPDPQHYVFSTLSLGADVELDLQVSSPVPLECKIKADGLQGPETIAGEFLDIKLHIYW